MIERLNAQFVCTWVLVADARRRAAEDPDNALAHTIAANWEFPLDMMFLTADGKLVSKLNSFRDLKAAHQDVGHPPEGRGSTAPHIDAFFQHLDEKHPLPPPT